MAEIHPDLVAILNTRAGREHSATGTVMAALGEILDRHLEILAAAGRLLPEYAPLHTEWGVSGAPDARGNPFRCATQVEAEESVRYWRWHGKAARLATRRVHAYPDGSSFTGPWVAVDQTENRADEE